MMSDNELKRLAHFIVLEQASNEEWMTSFAKAQAKIQKTETRLVSPRKAAEILGISVWQLYRIKDDEDGKAQFSYVKTGDKQSSTLKFNAATLIEEYDRYLASKKKNVIALPKQRKVVGL